MSLDRVHLTQKDPWGFLSMRNFPDELTARNSSHRSRVLTSGSGGAKPIGILVILITEETTLLIVVLVVVVVVVVIILSTMILAVIIVKTEMTERKGIMITMVTASSGFYLGIPFSSLATPSLGFRDSGFRA